MPINKQQSIRADLAAAILMLAFASVYVYTRSYDSGQYSDTGMTQAPPGAGHGSNKVHRRSDLRTKA